MSIGILVYASEAYDNILDFKHYMNEALQLENDIDFSTVTIVCKDMKNEGIHKWLQEFTDDFIPCKLIAFQSCYEQDGKYARSNRDKLMIKTCERFTAPNKTPILVIFWNLLDTNDSYQYLLHKMIEKCSKRGFKTLIVDSETSFSIQEYKAIQDTKDNFFRSVQSLEYQFKGKSLGSYITANYLTKEEEDDLENW